MNENLEKGRALEQAVRFIQETILKSDPKLSGIEFSIETDKWLTIGGVRHNFDVLVKTLPNSLYESTWIFECKNWNEPVGKNEVIVLAEKVDALRANRGFVVAKAFTKDAEAQLKRDSRLSFIPCTDDFLSPLNHLELIHAEHDLLPIRISIKERGVPPSEHPRLLDWREIKCRLKGEPTGFPTFAKTHVDQLVSDDQKENSAKYRGDSTHFGKRAAMIEFEVGEFMIGDMDVQHMVFDVQFWVTVRRRKVISKFELKGQGRAFHFEPIDDIVPGKRIEIDVVQRL